MEDIKDWEAYRKGNKAAFEQIFRQYIRLLYKYGNRFTADTGIVEDCIQELFIDLWEKRSSIGETDSIKRYLLGALRRRIVRKLQKQQPFAQTEENNDFEIEVNFEALLIDRETNSENQSKLEKAMASLSKRQKEIIYLKYYQELTFPEIEETLGINYQSARNLLHKALQAIKASFPTVKQIILLVIVNLLF